jgi:hypothetical protein
MYIIFDFGNVGDLDPTVQYYFISPFGPMLLMFMMSLGEHADAMNATYQITFTILGKVWKTR